MPSVINMFFFFNDTATTEIYTLSLHDALPICLIHRCRPEIVPKVSPWRPGDRFCAPGTSPLLPQGRGWRNGRDRKSTRPELQSRQYLVCRLLLEKKKTKMMC